MNIVGRLFLAISMLIVMVFVGTAGLHCLEHWVRLY